MQKIMLIFAISSSLQFCELISPSERMVTGVREVQNEDGSTSIVATAKASEKSILKGRTAMMRTTSCDAAKLMLRNKIRELKPDFNFDENSLNEAELLDNGKYCRIWMVLPEK